MTELRVVLVDDEVVSRVERVDGLEARGCTVVAGRDVRALTERLRSSEFAVPNAVILCGRDGSDLQDEIYAVRQAPLLAKLPLVVLADVEIRDALKALRLEVDVWLDADVGAEALLARLESGIGTAMDKETVGLVPAMVLELTQALSSKLDTREILSLVVRRIGEVLAIARVSIVLATGDERAFVVTASDDLSLRDLPIRLEDYPEIQQALETKQAVEITDLGSYPPFVAGSFRVPQQVRSLTLCPISFEDKAKGVIFLRHDRCRKLRPNEMFLLRAVANATGIALRNAQLVSSLREHSERSTTAHANARRQVKAMRRYLEFFNAAADGILVLDLGGKIMFCNPAASGLAGYEPEKLVGSALEELLPSDGIKTLRHVLQQLSASASAKRVDLPLLTRQQQRRVLDVSFNRGTSEDAIVIVSLRDVTHERSIARELNRTKGFLERVIDSSVDAIVSADNRGVILVYNPAAEKVYGWPTQEVLGRMNVRDFYPAGIAQEVMRRIRSVHDGAAGTLRNYETDLLDCRGERVPARLSAALINHRGRTIGSVGVFHDLRATRKIEHRLAQTEKELAAQERKALIAELAGTAAHELNQPLTAMMAYAQLVDRHVQDSPDARRIAGKILAEAERMAKIVKKIGTITKYETKQYVGNTRILDLGGDAKPDKKD
jgi:PAS domain S-box-containing protein